MKPQVVWGGNGDGSGDNANDGEAADEASLARPPSPPAVRPSS